MTLFSNVAETSVKSTASDDQDVPCIIIPDAEPSEVRESTPQIRDESQYDWTGHIKEEPGTETCKILYGD